MVWDEQGSGGGSAKIVFVPRTSQLTSRFAIFRAGLREGRHLERYTPPPLQCFDQCARKYFRRYSNAYVHQDMVGSQSQAPTCLIHRTRVLSPASTPSQIDYSLVHLVPNSQLNQAIPYNGAGCLFWAGASNFRYHPRINKFLLFGTFDCCPSLY